MHDYLQYVVQYFDQAEGWTTLSIYTSAAVAMDLIAYMRQGFPDMKMQVLVDPVYRASTHK